MTHFQCDYAGDRDEALIGTLYNDIDPAVSAVFEAHLTTCAACRDELSALGGVRARLGQWAPPERQAAVGSQQSAVGSRQMSVQAPLIERRAWWREIPAWTQVAAALLFLGVAAAIANLDVRYDASGLSVRTGWSTRANPVDTRAPAPGGEPSAPWQADLAALEERLRAEPRATFSAGAVEAAAIRPDRPTAPQNAAAMGLVRTLITESERRQQRELALRVGEIVREFNAQRQADLVKIDRSMGVLQNNTGVEVMRQRELLAYYLRTAQRQQ